MILRLLLALFLLILTSAAHAQDIEPVWLEVADVALRLRSGPSGEDEVITQLTPREAVVLLERGEAWSQVRRQDGLTGWAHNDYLLPWDERNRPDTWRRVGDRRLFRVQDEVSLQWFTVDAELRAISDHAWFYTHARSDDDFLPDDRNLQRLGEQFDERVYLPSLELWDIRDPPAIRGDERVVVLVTAGFGDGFRTAGKYASSQFMPQEAGPNGIGFVSLSLSGEGSDLAGFSRSGDDFILAILAHEFRHMLHHHTGGNQARWVDEGLAEFSKEYLGIGTHVNYIFAFLRMPETPCNPAGPVTPEAYGAGHLFTTYLYERLGMEALRDFAEHPQQGLAALDALLAERNTGMGADTFFADWVLANYLFDAKRENGRYGYRMLSGFQPPVIGHVRKLPVGFRESVPSWATDYYEVSPSAVATSDRLLLDFRLSAPPPQDAWLQLVQVLPGHIDVQRFRASEHRNRQIVAALENQPERVFLAVSPVTGSLRWDGQPVNYSLALRDQPEPAEASAQATTTLHVRSGPEIADNILGKLQHCSFVQVLERGEKWSRVLNSDGLTGWSHNDFLEHRNSPGSTPSASCARLTRAAHDGDLAAVQRLLASGFPVNGADPFGRTALHEAAFWGHATILADLLRAGADFQARDATGRTPLDEALRTGNANILEILHAAGANLDLSDPSALPMLIDAAARGNSSLLQLILAEGHNVDWRDDSGRTALAAAAQGGQSSTLKQLLNAGADPGWQDENGRSLLMLAGASGDLESLALLHAAGGVVNRRESGGHTALTLAAANGHAMTVAWLLLNSDVDVHHTLPVSARNALHLASAAGHDDVVALLLLGDIDFLTEDAGGRTALQLADDKGHAGVARLLRIAESHPQKMTRRDRRRLNLRARLDQRFTQEDVTTFLDAARYGNLAEIDRLLAGDRIALDLRDREYRTPLMLAASAGQRDVVLRLLRAGANFSATQQGFQHHQSALYHAIRGGHDIISAMLLLAGESPYAPGYQTPGPLHWAAHYGRPDSAYLLLGMPYAGLPLVDALDWTERTPLFRAVVAGRSEMVDLLLNAGASPDIPDVQGTTALGFAVMDGEVDIVKSLLAAGASPDGQSDDIPSPLDMARWGGNHRIIRLLLAAGAEA